MSNLNIQEIVIRLINDTDSFEDLTSLLHRSYGVLKNQGMNYVAATQSVEVTQKRIRKSFETYVALHKGELIGTISLYKNKSNDNHTWYDNDFVMKVGQFAVDPRFQSIGLGSQMLATVEAKARSINGVNELALDTSENASKLLAYYRKRGYRDIQLVDWSMVNYKSIILSKKLIK